MKPLFGVSLIVAASSLVASQLPEKSATIASCSGTLAALAVVTIKPRRVILRLGSLSWTREELCRHMLITGDTGSGKTTSGFQPILIQITRNEPNWGGLVLGVKGDEHRFVSELLTSHGRSADMVHLQVRPATESTKWNPPHRYNLVSDRSIPWTTHAKAIVDLSASMTEGVQHAFFRPMAQIALANAFELLDEAGDPVTIARAYKILTDRDEAAEFVRPFLRPAATERQQYLAKFLSSTLTQAKAHEQKEAIEGTIKTYLGFFMDPDIINVFSSDEDNTFSFSELENGAVVSVTMPQRFQTERRYIQTYLKILFYYHVLRRFDQPERQASQRNLLLLVADEFQGLVTASEDGISDHNVIDRIRSAGAGIIAGMQSEISADPAITAAKRKVLTLNMRSRLIFRAADADGAKASADFIGQKKVVKTSRTSRAPGAPSITRTEQEDYAIKPYQLMSLADHQAVVVHPSKRFSKQRLVPRDGTGRPYSWF